MRFCHALLVPLGAFGLSACDLVPTYQRPDPQTPPAYREQVNMPGIAATPGPAAISQSWWQSFGSSELDTLVQRADAGNLDIAAAVARVEEADAQARISGAALLPSVVANPQVERTKVNVPMHENYPAYQLTAEASYELDFWGKNRSAYDASRENAIAVNFDRAVVQLTTETGTATSFFQYAGLESRIAVARQNLAAAEAVLDGLKKEFAAGIATELDITQQETEVASVTASLPPLEQQASQALDSLAILLGVPPEQLTLSTQSIDALQLPSVAPGLPSQLLARRPDVREGEARLLAANYNIGNARAQFFPDITLTAEGGVQSESLAQLFTPQGLMYDLVASATQPIFEGGRLTGQLDYSKAAYREQLADYRKAVISAFGDVENNLAAASRTREALTQQAVALGKARAAFQMAQTQFKVGTVNLLTVLTTETTLFASEDAYVEARLAHLQALVGLIKALGGGWSDQAAPPTPDNETEAAARAP